MFQTCVNISKLFISVQIHRQRFQNHQFDHVMISGDRGGCEDEICGGVCVDVRANWSPV